MPQVGYLLLQCVGSTFIIPVMRSPLCKPRSIGIASDPGPTPASVVSFFQSHQTRWGGRPMVFIFDWMHEAMGCAVGHAALREGHRTGRSEPRATPWVNAGPVKSPEGSTEQKDDPEQRSCHPRSRGGQQDGEDGNDGRNPADSSLIVPILPILFNPLRILPKGECCGREWSGRIRQSLQLLLSECVFQDDGCGPPLQGSSLVVTISQGVALGYHSACRSWWLVVGFWWYGAAELQRCNA